MAETYMSPRSSVYSGGDLVPYRERSDFGSVPSSPSSFALGTEPAASSPSRQGGFLAGLERFAGTVAPFVEAAVAFKRGYNTGLPLPGRYGGSRMAGQEFIFQVLEDMRARNDIAAERAREERETARKQDLLNQIALKAYENKEISLSDLMKQIKTGDFGSLESSEALPTQQQEAKPTPQQ